MADKVISEHEVFLSIVDTVLEIFKGVKNCNNTVLTPGVSHLWKGGVI